MPRKPRCRTVNWCWEEFLFDTRVSAMTNEELGAWVRVLGALAMAEIPGVMHREAIRRAAGGSYVIIEAMFEVDGDLMRHKRTIREHEEQTVRVEVVKARKTAAGQKSAMRPRRADGTLLPADTPTEHPTGVGGVGPTGGPTDIQPPSFLPSVLPESKSTHLSPNGDGYVPRKRRKTPTTNPDLDREWLETFDEVWWPEYYSLRGQGPSKASAREVWAKIPHADGQADFDRLTTSFDVSKSEWKNASDKRFIPHADKWLRHYLKDLMLEAQ